MNIKKTRKETIQLNAFGERLVTLELIGGLLVRVLLVVLLVGVLGPAVVGLLVCPTFVV
jgi:hypothetical protein